MEKLRLFLPSVVESFPIQTVEVKTSKLWEQGYAVRPDGVGIEHVTQNYGVTID